VTHRLATGTLDELRSVVPLVEEAHETVRPGKAQRNARCPVRAAPIESVCISSVPS
jgi:hypothetical protein